jgi:dihydrofolate reductase
MTINAILACDLNFGIGNEGALPWPKNTQDMQWFRKHTQGHVVVMGRKTWQSIGAKPLPKRINVVVTSKSLQGADFTASGDMEDILHAVQEKWPHLHIWIMGGAEIYSQALPHCDKLYLTTINRAYTCDAYVETDIIVRFPIIEHWDERPDITFQIRRKKQGVQQ